MGTDARSHVHDVLSRHEKEILGQWVQRLVASTSSRPDLIRETELREQCRHLLELLRQATQHGALDDIDGGEWSAVRGFLGDLSRSRAHQGFAPSETAAFVFSLREPISTSLRREIGNDAGAFADELSQANQLIDRLGLYTTEVYQRSREEVISRQQQEMMELSTPVVQLWEGVLGLPVIGTLDSARTQVVMESLLQRIVDTGAQIAIIDITGVPTVDTLVAQHLLKTVAAARLMGADCIISGIRPQIAQTIVHLGVELNNVVTKATLADALTIALQRVGLAVGRAASRA